jgi:hypothetical protein
MYYCLSDRLKTFDFAKNNVDIILLRLFKVVMFLGRILFGAVLSVFIKSDITIAVFRLYVNLK